LKPVAKTVIFAGFSELPASLFASEAEIAVVGSTGTGASLSQDNSRRPNKRVPPAAGIIKRFMKTSLLCGWNSLWNPAINSSVATVAVRLCFNRKREDQK
jgi:hypothetical protein